MSASGKSRIEPPASYAEWADLVAATVSHLNVDRKLGIHYWEDWNEPDLGDFWRASFGEYLRLYDATVEAALGVDPTIAIGGPAFASFKPISLANFLEHEASLGAHGRADFVSWHAYGRSPDALAEEIKEARAITERFPILHPELFITEFNVLQGGPGDTSVNSNTDKVEGAIALLASIEAMQREHLDRAFLFELKDGLGPSRYWGRWGILTNDGSPKPIYHAYKAYQDRPRTRLPIKVLRGPTNGSLGFLAFGSERRSSLMLWLTGDKAARVKIALPPEYLGLEYNVTLFDDAHNNPSKSGDTNLRQSPPRNAGDLVFDLKPNSLVLLTSTGQ